MSLTQELLTFGLTDKEAEVYLAALQLGYSSVQEIATQSGINRTTAYTHVKNLISRGLLKAVERNSKLFYIAEKPDKLQYIFEQQEKEIKRRREVLNDIMPQLESIYNLAKDKPTVRYFDHTNDNLESVRTEIQNIRTDEMLNIYNHERFSDYINKKHVQTILDNVKRFKVIYISKQPVYDARVQALQNDDRFRIKYLSEDRFGFLCEVLIAKDKVYIARNQDSLLISDDLFSQTLTLLFHALWGIAEEV